jgi:hypothetical protein
VLGPNAYFVLARPDNFYVWRDATTLGTVEPSQVIPTVDVLAPYISSALTSSLRDLSKESFELVVRTWLEDLVRSGSASAPAAENQKRVFESGLYEAIKHGRVVRG